MAQCEEWMNSTNCPDYLREDYRQKAYASCDNEYIAKVHSAMFGLKLNLNLDGRCCGVEDISVGVGIERDNLIYGSVASIRGLAYQRAALVARGPGEAEEVVGCRAVEYRDCIVRRPYGLKLSVELYTRSVAL